MTNKNAYIVMRSRRKTVAIEILPTMEVRVKAPLTMADGEIACFVQEHQSWIDGKLATMAKCIATDPQMPIDDTQVRQLAEAAVADFGNRVHHFAPLVGVEVGRITIRCQRSRWGSCSSKGNLNFNCLLMLAPESVRDYVVVHELCHRLHMNHSEAFWREVARVLPTYKAERLWLKHHGNALMRRRMLGEGQ